MHSAVKRQGTTQHRRRCLTHDQLLTLLTYSITHSLTHSLTYSLNHSITHLLTGALTHPLAHSVGGSVEQSECYEDGHGFRVCYGLYVDLVFSEDGAGR